MKNVHSDLIIATEMLDRAKDDLAQILRRDPNLDMPKSANGSEVAICARRQVSRLRNGILVYENALHEFLRCRRLAGVDVEETKGGVSKSA